MRITALAISLYFCIICGVCICAKEQNFVENGIVLVTKPIPGTHVNEEIEPAPFETIYMEGTSSLVINSYYNIGDILVSIINDSGTFYHNDVINAYPNSAVIPISGEPGYYTITYTILSTGAEYISTFQL